MSDGKIWINDNPRVHNMFSDENNRPVGESHGVSFSDDFRNTNGKDVFLVAGCSITALCGMTSWSNIGNNWSRLLFNKIKNTDNYNSYINLSISGASIFEIIMNVFKYLYQYEKPKVIFLLLPGSGRHTAEITKTEEGASTLTYHSYYLLHEFCKINNIELFASSWDSYIPGINHFFVKKEGGSVNEILNEFDTFYEMDNNFVSDIAYLNRHLGLVGEDDSHPGSALHIAYFNFFNKVWEENSDHSRN